MKDISIEKKEDPFYEMRKTQNGVDDEYMERYEKICIPKEEYCLPVEKVLRRLYHSRWLTAGADFEIRSILQWILVKIPYANVDSIKRLGVFENPKNASAYISKYICSEKNENGFLRVFNTQANRCRKAYTLTNAARQETLYELPEVIQKQLASTKKMSSAANVHDAFCCNLYYYLLSDFGFPEFDWHFGTYFNFSKTFSETLSSDKDAFIQSNARGLKPDAFIETLEEIPSYYFVEQDMNTERAGRLSEKLENYIKILSTMTPEQVNSTTFLFQIFIDSKAQSRKRSTGNKSDRLLPAQLKKLSIELAVFVHSSNSGYTQPVSEIKDLLLEKMDTSMVPRHGEAIKNQYTGMLAIISEFQEKHSSNKEGTVSDLFKFIDKQLDSQQQSVVEKDRAYTDRILTNRKKAIRKIISEQPAFQNYLRNGVRFMVTDTFYPEELHYALLSDHDDGVLSNVLLPRLGTVLGLKGDFSYVPILQIGNVYLSNYCTFDQHPEMIITVENISTDLGAIYRLQNFIERVDVFPQNDKKVCFLILASNMNDIREFNETAYKQGTVAERYCDEKDAKKPKNNIQILYSIYSSDEKNVEKFFVLDRKGQVCYV